MADLDLERYRLSDVDHDRIFRQEIVPAELGALIHQEHPVAVFVGGQPGAGKTATTAGVLDRLAARGGPAHVCGDLYKPYHPAYRRLLAVDEATAGAYTRLDTRAWHAKAEAYARDQRADVVIETALSGPSGFTEPAAAFRAAGYRVEVAALAVPAALSRLGIVARYVDQVAEHGHGRMVTTDNHDACYRGILDTAAQIDTGHLADIVQVLRRGNHLVHANHLTQTGQWATRPQMRQAIEAERDRPWTTAEARDFLHAASSLTRQLDPGWHPRLTAVIDLARPHLPPGSEAAARASQSFPTGLAPRLPGSDPATPSRAFDLEVGSNVDRDVDR
ncbi:MAG: zeta toxin family protein [Angustibacter sp.]